MREYSGQAEGPARDRGATDHPLGQCRLAARKAPHPSRLPAGPEPSGRVPRASAGDSQLLLGYCEGTYSGTVYSLLQ